MARDRLDMRRAIGRTTDRGIHHDRVLKRLSRQNPARRQILVHHLDDAPPGLIRKPRALAIRSGNRRAARQRHPQRFRQRIHRQRRTHRVAVSGTRRRRHRDLDQFIFGDIPRRQLPPRFPKRHAGPRQLAVEVAVDHRTAGKHDRRHIHRRRGHQTSGSGLIAGGGQYDAIEGIPHQNFHQTQISQIAVERGGRTPATLLNRMHRKLEGNTTRSRECRL